MIKTKSIFEADKNSFTTPSVKPVCTIEVNQIIAWLHVKALEKSKTAGIVIENTSVSGEQADSAKFHGAGEHMIIAKSEKPGEKLDIKDAFKALVAYVSAFVGPDIGKKLKQDQLQTVNMSEKSSSSDNKTDTDQSEKKDGE